MIMWLHNGTVQWLDSMTPAEKEEKMTQARRASEDVLQRYKERREKIKQHRQKKEKEKRETNKKVMLTNKIAKLGGVWRSATEVDHSLSGMASEKDKMLVLVTQLQFHKSVLKAEGAKELFQQSVTRDGRSHAFSLKELQLNLLEVLKENQVVEGVEEDNQLEPAPTYRSEEEVKKRLSEEKQKLSKKLAAARQKRERMLQKNTLTEFLENPDKFVGKRVNHNCCEEVMSRTIATTHPPIPVYPGVGENAVSELTTWVMEI
ncbi:hypothetical protein SKAU_G00061160 [Synaphobranchus kaupii]|uniref:Uncharacterized protein n=1 Tax=Synaphobranchus kaupii TaxID=118154 RepID=A0A9Q1G5F1_SYNKA|nr:hypothetical protein SKAU_G00061160 [Synaphobranchus kaupii]